MPGTSGRTAGAVLPRGLVVLLGCAAAVVVVAGLKAMAWLIAPALLALVVVIAVSPVRQWLRRRGVPAWVETSATVAAVYGVLLLFGLVVVVSVARLGSLLPGYLDRGRELLVDAAAAVGRTAGDPDTLRDVVESIEPSRGLAAVGPLLGGVTGAATNVVFLLALLLFLSAESGEADARLDELSTDRGQLGDALRGF